MSKTAAINLNPDRSIGSAVSPGRRPTNHSLLQDIDVERQLADLRFRLLDVRVLQGLFVFGPTRQGVFGTLGHFLCQSSISPTANQCFRAASASAVSHFRMLTTSVTCRLAVHRSIGSEISQAAVATSCHGFDHGCWVALTVAYITEGTDG
jgi:hypothetical protein